MTASRRVWLLALLMAALNANGDMVVEGLQYPVWVSRDGVNVALAPGVSVLAGEQVLTGEGGKIWLKMADDARVKIGPEATVNIGSVVATAPSSAQPEGALEAAMDVVRGAFRYTTGELSRFWQRDVRIGLSNTATIGIRGTDLWGQVDGENQFVVLLEGKITVQPHMAGAAMLTMQTPLQIYRTGEPRLSSVGMDAVQALAPITELDLGAGVMRQGGSYQLHLSSFADQEQAQALVQRLNRSGLASSAALVRVNGRDWWRVSVEALASLQDAQALRRRLIAVEIIESAWISRV
jgi:hypothetical protein